MQSVRECAELRGTLANARARGKRIAFVPTLGNLHAGHLALVKRAVELADLTVVSIFVNPFQFAPGEDYEAYPRTLDADLKKLVESGADLLFLPEVSEIYPRGSEHATVIEVPALGDVLCGEHRPGFFRGVATVLGILFNLVAPDVALFGEKDFQQLLVVRRMVWDLHLPIDIIPVPTVRESSGLAMSSRNAYLNNAETATAPELYRQLGVIRDAIQAGERNFESLEVAAIQALKKVGFRPDYFSVRTASALMPPGEGDMDLVILAAAWLGKARLIDNLSIAPHT